METIKFVPHIKLGCVIEADNVGAVFKFLKQQTHSLLEERYFDGSELIKVLPSSTTISSNSCPDERYLYIALQVPESSVILLEENLSSSCKGKFWSFELSE